MKQLNSALCKLTPLAIQCCLTGVHKTYKKGSSKDVYDQLCCLIEDKHLNTGFLTTDSLPYTVAMLNKMTNVSDEMKSTLPDGDAKAIIHFFTFP